MFWFLYWKIPNPTPNTKKPKPAIPKPRPLFLARSVVGLLPHSLTSPEILLLEVWGRGRRRKVMIWLEKLILALAPTLPFLNHLVELCGSMAMGGTPLVKGTLSTCKGREWCLWGGTLGSDLFSISSGFRGAELRNCSSKYNYIKLFPVWHMPKESYRWILTFCFQTVIIPPDKSCLEESWYRVLMHFFGAFVKFLHAENCLAIVCLFFMDRNCYAFARATNFQYGNCCWF